MEDKAVELNVDNMATKADMAETKAEKILESNTEQVETPEQSSIVEQDGEIYLVDDSAESEPETTPDDGQVASDNQEAEETSTKEYPEMYQDKTLDEVVEMHQNAQRKISEQGDELGQLRSTIESKPKEMNEKEVFNQISSDEIRNALHGERDKLSNLDQYDPDYNDQKVVVDNMERDLMIKTSEEAVQTRMNESDNIAFMQEQSEQFKQDGVEINDDEFGQLTEQAMNYTTNGRLDGNSYAKALIDVYGMDMVTKHYAVQGEQKARNDIASASNKVVERVDVTGSGKNAKLVRLNDMSSPERRKLLQNLSDTDLNRLVKNMS